MAENDSTQHAEPLTDNDTYELISKRLCQAGGICSIVSLAEDHWDEVPRNSLSMAMWAVRDLINSAHDDFSSLDTKRRNALRTQARAANAEAANG